MSEKRQEVICVADELYRKNPNWVTFFREVLGVDGILRRTYGDAAALAEFQKTEEYQQIDLMLKKLREQGDGEELAKEPTRVITVRMPKSLHECLRVQAKDYHMSMNQLCISKLLQLLDGEPIGVEQYAVEAAN